MHARARAACVCLCVTLCTELVAVAFVIVKHTLAIELTLLLSSIALERAYAFADLTQLGAAPGSDRRYAVLPLTRHSQKNHDATTSFRNGPDAAGRDQDRSGTTAKPADME